MQRLKASSDRCSSTVFSEIQIEKGKSRVTDTFRQFSEAVTPYIMGDVIMKLQGKKSKK